MKGDGTQSYIREAMVVVFVGDNQCLGSPFLQRGYVNFTLGRGDRVQFWEDCWCSLEPLKCMFPHLAAYINKIAEEQCERFDVGR